MHGRARTYGSHAGRFQFHVLLPPERRFVRTTGAELGGLFVRSLLSIMRRNSVVLAGLGDGGSTFVLVIVIEAESKAEMMELEYGTLHGLGGEAMVEEPANAGGLGWPCRRGSDRRMVGDAMLGEDGVLARWAGPLAIPKQ